MRAKIWQTYPGENREKGESNGCSHIAWSNWGFFTLTPLVGEVAKSNEVQESPESRESQIAQHIVFPCFDRRHLLKQVFTGQKSSGCKESNNSYANTVVASIAILVVQAYFLLRVLRVFLPTLRWYAAKDNYGKKLKHKNKNLNIPLWNQHFKLTKTVFSQVFLTALSNAKIWLKDKCTLRVEFDEAFKTFSLSCVSLLQLKLKTAESHEKLQWASDSWQVHLINNG